MLLSCQNNHSLHSSTNVYQPWHFLSPPQGSLLPAGLPICLTPSSLCLGFCWALCAFISYIFLLTIKGSHSARFKCPCHSNIKIQTLLTVIVICNWSDPLLAVRQSTLPDLLDGEQHTCCSTQWCCKRNGQYVPRSRFTVMHVANLYAKSAWNKQAIQLCTALYSWIWHTEYTQMLRKLLVAPGVPWCAHFCAKHWCKTGVLITNFRASVSG